MAEFTMVRNEASSDVNRIFEKVASVAKDSNADVSIFKDEEGNPQVMTIKSDYTMSRIFRHFYFDDDAVVMAAEGIMLNRYNLMVSGICQEIRGDVEKRVLECESDVMDAIENLCDSQITNDSKGNFVLVNTRNSEAWTDESTAETVQERAVCAMKQDVLDELGDIDDLIEELSCASDDDKEAAVREVQDAIDDLLSDDDLLHHAAWNVTDNNKIAEELIDYLRDELGDIVRKFVRDRF